MDLAERECILPQEYERGKNQILSALGISFFPSVYVSPVFSLILSVGACSANMMNM